MGSRIYPNGTVVLADGTIEQGTVFWGAIDPREPRSILPLAPILQRHLPSNVSLNIELLTSLDNQRIARELRESRSRGSSSEETSTAGQTSYITSSSLISDPKDEPGNSSSKDQELSVLSEVPFGQVPPLMQLEAVDLAQKLIKATATKLTAGLMQLRGQGELLEQCSLEIGCKLRDLIPTSLETLLTPEDCEQGARNPVCSFPF